MSTRTATMDLPDSERKSLEARETDKRIHGILNGSDNDPLPCHVECSIEKALDVLGGKWTFLIIRDLQTGKKRFGELRKSLAGVSPKTLSERLKELEEKGVVTRTAYATIPPTVEYALTEKGESLHPIIKAMKLWGSQVGLSPAQDNKLPYIIRNTPPKTIWFPSGVFFRPTRLCLRGRRALEIQKHLCFAFVPPASASEAGGHWKFKKHLCFAFVPPASASEAGGYWKFKTL